MNLSLNQQRQGTILVVVLVVVLLIAITGGVFFVANQMIGGLGLAQAAGNAVASSQESVAGTFYSRIVGNTDPTTGIPSCCTMPMSTAPWI